MEKYYFTFGTAHTLFANGVTWGADVICEITAEDYGQARQKMVDVFGDKWAFQYDIKEIQDQLRFCRRGIIALDPEDRKPF